VPSGCAPAHPGWRVRIIASMIALVGVSGASFVWHGELGEDDNCCVVCHLRDSSVADLAPAVQVDPSVRSESIGQSGRVARFAVDRGYRLSPRAPPA